MSERRKLLSPAARQAEISEHVNRRGEATVEQLSARFGASAETIRRDLGLLENAGHLRKVHGGAKALLAAQEAGFGTRLRRNALAKQLIAEKVLKVVKPGMTLFMDTGSTTQICAQTLARVKRLTVITNATRVAAAFAEGTGRAGVYLLGGRYRGDNAQTVGDTAIQEIGLYRADMAILTVGALNETGVMDFSNQEAEVARAMVRASGSVTVVADHSKFDQTAAFRVAGLEGVNNLVADREPGRSLMTALRQAGTEFVA